MEIVAYTKKMSIMKQSSMMKFEIKAFYRETTMANLSTKIKGVERDDHALKVQAENVLNPKIEGNVENAQGINALVVLQ